MSYKISELEAAKSDFRAVFHTGLGTYIETFITAATLSITIDIVAFDKFLRKQHPDNQELSLTMLIEKYYGAHGNALIDKLI